MRLAVTMLSFSMAVTAFAQAQSAHVHGAAQMSVALVDSVLEIELHAPAESFWGFEYAAKSTDERATEQNALAALKKGGWLALPSSAVCTLAKSSAARSADVSDNAKHAHDHEHADEATSAHTNVKVSLQFHCKQAEDLTRPNAIELHLFSAFASLNTVDLQGITDTGQVAKRLTAKDFRFGL